MGVWSTATGSEVRAHILELPEWYELHNVPHGCLARSRAQNSIISIQELHGSEVGPAHPDNDDGHGQTGGIDDGTAGLVHVCDDSIGDYEENKVILRGGDMMISTNLKVFSD